MRNCPLSPDVSRGGKPNGFAPTGVTRWWRAIPDKSGIGRLKLLPDIGPALRGLADRVNPGSFEPCIHAVRSFHLAFFGRRPFCQMFH